MMKNILFGILLALVLVPASFAQFPLTEFTNISCSSEFTLSVINNETRCINGVCRDFLKQSEVFCEFGCANDTVIPQCSPDPVNTTLFFTIPIIVFFIVVAAIILRRMD